MNKFNLILIPFAILLFSFTLVLTDLDFYQSQLEKNNVTENLNLTEDIDVKATLNNEILNIISYLAGKTEVLESKLFGEKEISHMEDVKNIIKKFIYASYILIAITLLLLVFDKDKGRTLLYSGLTSIILLIILLGIFLNFDYFFIKFHEIVFSNENWLFDPSSPIVNIFPKQFFIDFLKQVLIYTLIASVVMMIIGFLLNKFKRKELDIDD